ncbi:uncharacterized protein BDV14DRAFT_198511 [Aspergillus stella-maris]|uniref:uncharacterized protein n=1 Tax=Aspergillus stella-maris TaxID=1810926 RepID=UPI003CCD5387
MPPRIIYLGVADVIDTDSNSRPTIIVVLKEKDRQQCEWFFCSKDGDRYERVVACVQRFPGFLYEMAVELGSLRSSADMKVLEKAFNETLRCGSGLVMGLFLQGLVDYGLLEKVKMKVALERILDIKACRENEVLAAKQESLNPFRLIGRALGVGSSRGSLCSFLKVFLMLNFMLDVHLNPLSSRVPNIHSVKLTSTI